MTNFEEIIEQKIKNNRGLYNTMLFNMKLEKKDFAKRVDEVGNQKEAMQLRILVNNLIADFEFIEKLQAEYEELLKEKEKCSIS